MLTSICLHDEVCGWRFMNDKVFLDSLGDDDVLREKYLSEKKKRLKTVERDFKKEEEVLKQNLRNEIMIDQQHLEILNCCVFPFQDRGLLLASTGYKLYRLSPLSELGVKNVDFLLFKKTDNFNL